VWWRAGPWEKARRCRRSTTPAGVDWIALGKVRAFARTVGLGIVDSPISDLVLRPVLCYMLNIEKPVKSSTLSEMTISAEQCRMARAGLGMTAAAVAAAAGVSKVTLSDFEIGKRSPHPRTLAAIRSALESAGIEFIAENGSGPGVRLRKRLS
jgi:DNA-binding transcriptional regulator YiaG